MRYRFWIVLLSLACCGASGQTLSDVPASHWARTVVREVISRGVMEAPKGRFEGARKVTRRELAITLAALARSLEQGKWTGTNAPALKRDIDATKPAAQSVTRYELAAVIGKVARYAAKGLPRATGKAYPPSEALPAEAPKIAVAKSDPAYESVAYLVKNRMAFAPSVALKPGSQPVTGKEVAQALAMMIIGLNDRLTDEPQNRDDLGPPPRPRR